MNFANSVIIRDASGIFRSSHCPKKNVWIAFGLDDKYTQLIS